jgi:signal transduction histidine kinase
MTSGIASIRVSEITVGANTLIAVSVRDLSRMHQIGLQKTQKMYQSILTNALSHERMTPLNAIINGCEFIQ